MAGNMPAETPGSMRPHFPNMEETYGSTSHLAEIDARVITGDASRQYNIATQSVERLRADADTTFRTMEFISGSMSYGADSIVELDGNEGSEDIIPPIDDTLWTAVGSLVTDFSAQDIIVIPFLALACYVRPGETQIATFLRTQSRSTDGRSVHAVLISPLMRGEVSCSSDAFERSLALAPEEYTAFLDSQEGQVFLDTVYEELTGSSRQADLLLEPVLRRCDNTFAMPLGIVAQLEFDMDVAGLRDHSVPRGLGTIPPDVSISIGTAGAPSPSKAGLRPGVFTDSGKASYGQDSSCAVGRNLLGVDGIQVARISCAIVADGHGNQVYGLEWSAGAVQMLSARLMSPQMDYLYLLFQIEAGEEVITKTLRRIVQEVHDEIRTTVLDAAVARGEPRHWAEMYLNSGGTTLAINLTVTFLQGQFAGISRIATVTLGDSSIVTVELSPDGIEIASVDALKNDGWDTPADYAEYLRDLNTVNAERTSRGERNIVPCQVRTGRNGAPQVFRVRGDQVTYDHRGIIAQITREYARPANQQRMVGGHQVSEERRRAMIRIRNGVETRYRIYGHVCPAKGPTWTYIGYADTGAVGETTDASPQFRSSMGDGTTSCAAGFLNVPKVSFRTTRGPIAIAVMSDGVADVLSDPEIVNRLATALRNGQAAPVLVEELVNRTREVAEDTWPANPQLGRPAGYDDISCAITLVTFPKPHAEPT